MLVEERWNTCEQEHVSLSIAILHNSVVQAKLTHKHVRYYSIGLLIVQWVVIGQYAMGQSLMHRSIVGMSFRTGECVGMGVRVQHSCPHSCFVSTFVLNCIFICLLQTAFGEETVEQREYTAAEKRESM